MVGTLSAAGIGLEIYCEMRGVPLPDGQRYEPTDVDFPPPSRFPEMRLPDFEIPRTGEEIIYVEVSEEWDLSPPFG